MKPIQHDGVAVIGPGQTYEGGQGFTYGAGCSAETVGATSICLNILPMPAGGVAKAHYHEGIETIALLLEGTCKVYYGEELEKSVEVQAGEQCFVAASVPHAPRNERGVACTWAVAHSAGSDQDGLVLTPALDEMLAKRFDG